MKVHEYKKPANHQAYHGTLKQFQLDTKVVFLSSNGFIHSTHSFRGLEDKVGLH